MQKQEVITIIQELPEKSGTPMTVKSYPVIDELLAKGMYIENIVQTAAVNNTYILTFVVRHYNEGQPNTQY